MSNILYLLLKLFELVVDRTRYPYWGRATYRSFVFHELLEVEFLYIRMRDLFLPNDGGYVFHTDRIHVIRVSGAR